MFVGTSKEIWNVFEKGCLASVGAMGSTTDGIAVIFSWLTSSQISSVAASADRPGRRNRALLSCAVDSGC